MEEAARPSPPTGYDNSKACFLPFCDVLKWLYLAIFIVILGAIPFGLITLGIYNLHNCSGQPCIPIFLIVFGFFSLLLILPLCRLRQQQTCVPRLVSQSDRQSYICDVLIYLFLLSWLIAGSTWVFSLSANYEDTTNPNYCERITYLASYVAVISGWILAGTIFIACTLSAICIRDSS